MRLRIVAEGQSEERFARLVLVPHLAEYGVFVTVTKVETSRMKRRPDIRFKGGVPAYKHIRNDVATMLRIDGGEDFRLTTFIDFFHLPKDFPGLREGASCFSKDQQIDCIEKAFREDIGDDRFMPYVQKHEFEALMFVDLGKLLKLYPQHDSKIMRLERGAKGLAPEDVNGGDTTSPSNRIIAEFPEHEMNKPKIVPLLAEIGLPRLREACPRFDRWIGKLEKLGSGGDRSVR